MLLVHRALATPRASYPSCARRVSAVKNVRGEYDLHPLEALRDVLLEHPVRALARVKKEPIEKGETGRADLGGDDVGLVHQGGDGGRPDVRERQEIRDGLLKSAFRLRRDGS